MDGNMKKFMLEKIVTHVLASPVADRLVLGQELIELLNGDDDAKFWTAFYQGIAKHTIAAEVDEMVREFHSAIMSAE